MRGRKRQNEIRSVGGEMRGTRDVAILLGARARVPKRERERERGGKWGEGEKGEKEEKRRGRGGRRGNHADRPGRDKARRCDPRDR